MKNYRCIRNGIERLPLLLITTFLCGIMQSVNAQTVPKKAPMSRASRYSNLPSGYSQVGNTQLYYKQYSDAIDMIGYYNGYYYSSTYSDYGYKLSVQVGDNSAVRVDCLNGTTNNGVTVQPSIEQQGELARICYVVTNTNEEDVVISLGTHADVMIGSNDRAPISRRTDTLEQTYGLTMMDGQGAQLCVLFGSGLAGVTAVSDFWFGGYSTNSNPYNMVGHYSSGSNYMVENGSYDSGMGWCWKDRTITAGSTVVFSYLIGVGEVNLEPNSSFEVTPDDPEGWNDLSRPHRLTLNGSYESPAGLDGIIDYAVEDSEEWTALTGTLASGDEFTASLVAMFDATKSTHVIRFRTRDLVGNTTMLHPIEYKDVSFHALTGIEEKTYTGDSLFQTNITCDMEEGQYELKAYRNNVNAGTASFNLEGVFPYTIGRKTYTFTINPQPLSGELLLANTEFVYSGQAFTPEWQFTNGLYSSLEEGRDYEIVWSENKLPGIGSLTVSGKNNYTGSLTATFNIDKALLTDNLYSLTLPAEDITYDEQSHGASITTAEGVGEATFSYMKQGDAEPTAALPSEAGDYTVYLEFADGTLYYGMERTQVGAFSIYQFNAEEWTILQTVLPKLSEMGWSQPWDVSHGMKSVSSLHGLTIEKGKVVGLDLGNASLTGLFPVELFAFTNLKSLILSDNNIEGAVETIAAYIQQNPEAGTNLSELNIANNSLSGNIGIMAACFPNLTSIDAHGNCLSDVYPMISSKVINIDISGQTIDRTVIYDLSSTTTEELASQIPTILVYDHGLQIYTKPLNLQCSMDDGFGMTLSYVDGHIEISDVSEQNAYHGESGDTIEVTALNTDPSKANSTMKLKLLFETGDANFIDGLDITDLQSTILYAFDDYPSYLPFNFTAADTYKDNTINVQDVVSTVNLLLSAPVQNQMSIKKSKENLFYEENLYDDNLIWIEHGKIMLKTVTPIAAMSIDISSSAGFDLSKYGMDVATRGTRTIAYSLTGGCLSEGIYEIGSCQNDAKIINVSMSTPDAQPLKVSILSDIPSSIEDINSDINDCYEIYNPNGIRISKPQRGINIIKHTDNRISKIYIR